jgi:hypothetical protein
MPRSYEESHLAYPLLAAGINVLCRDDTARSRRGRSVRAGCKKLSTRSRVPTMSSNDVRVSIRHARCFHQSPQGDCLPFQSLFRAVLQITRLAVYRSNCDDVFTLLRHKCDTSYTADASPGVQPCRNPVSPPCAWRTDKAPHVRGHAREGQCSVSNPL